MQTITVIKADVGSIGGHTCPSPRMIACAEEELAKIIEIGLLRDGRITFTGDDLCIIMSHGFGTYEPAIHDFAWEVFVKATQIAAEEGNYGAGQDLLADAPSGNVRGAGPGVAELSFDMTADERRAEAFLIFAADKCGPGAFNLPFYNVMTDVRWCSGLMLPNMIDGFSVKIIDMDHTDGDLVAIFNSVSGSIKIAALLRDENKFAILSANSVKFPGQQMLSLSTDRLHSIAGTYKGKDDPVAIFRVQGIFPAPEEVLMPWARPHIVAGGARGSHNMAIMPVALNTPVTGPYCQPIVSCAAFSLNNSGKLSGPVDMFGQPVWDRAREIALLKSELLRENGWAEPAMLTTDQLEYGPFRDTLSKLMTEFKAFAQ